MTAAWGAPAPPIMPLLCEDPGCPRCQTMEAGGRALCHQAGVEYDALDPHAKAHYGHIAGEVMAAMSERLLELGAVVEKGEPGGEDQG